MLPSIPRAMRLTGKVPPSYQVVEAVMSILRESPNGASTQEIYQRGAPKSIPRNAIESSSEHPFKSVRYLKKTVLATLQEKGVIEKFHVKQDAKVEEQVSNSKATKKKRTSNVPKFTFLWRIHEWERSVAESKERHEARKERTTTGEASSQPSRPSKAVA